MMLNILLDRTIRDVQVDFNKAYPYLKIEFYQKLQPGFSRDHLVPSTTTKNAGLKHEGVIEISDTMTVGQLETAFRDTFGLHVQVSRKSGILWLETTKSDNWTLKQQNDHGRELSQHDCGEKIDLSDVDYE